MTKMHLLCVAVLSACVLPHSAVAQPASAPGSPHKLEFDAVSVRPSQRKFVMIGTDFLDPVSKMPPPSGGLFTWNVHLADLIDFAYDLRSSQLRRQVFQGLPKPFNTMQEGWFAVDARAAGNPTRDDVRQMVRSMLEERFHFAAHMEKRDGAVLALTIDKPGPQLKPHADGDPCSLPSSLTDSKKYPNAYPPFQQVPPHCGVFNRELSRSGERRLEMLDVTVDQIASAISAMEPATVVDQSGLQGHYDAVLEYAPPMPQNAESSDDAVGAPQLPTALEKQLGVKLLKQTSQLDVFVIDRIDPLTEN